jgi:hypothetical protein
VFRSVLLLLPLIQLILIARAFPERRKSKREISDWACRSKGKKKAPSFFVRGREMRGGGAMRHRFLQLLLAVSASSALLAVLAADLNKGELSCFVYPTPVLASKFAAPAEILM